VPSTGDSKKAMDEYLSSIFMGGQNTLVLYNVCEDSLLAAPIIIDLFLLTELFERIEYRVLNQPDESFKKLDTVLSWLGYLLKSPRTEEGINVINALPRQK
jgi:myo-inositol-1-phosphate synthase